MNFSREESPILSAFLERDFTPGRKVTAQAGGNLFFFFFSWADRSPVFIANEKKIPRLAKSRKIFRKVGYIRRSEQR